MGNISTTVTLSAMMATLLSGCIAFNVGEPEHYWLDCGKDGSVLITRQKKMSFGFFPAEAELEKRPPESVKPMYGWSHMRKGRFERSSGEPAGRYCLWGLFTTPWSLLVTPWHGDYACDSHYWLYNNVELLSKFPKDVNDIVHVKSWRDRDCDLGMQSGFSHSSLFGFHRYATVVIEELDEGEDNSAFSEGWLGGLSSPATLECVRVGENVVNRFYVASIEGVANTRPPDKTDVNDKLAKRYPSVFKKTEGSIPLHVSISGYVAPNVPTGGKIAVTILIDDSGDKRVAYVPYRDCLLGSRGDKGNWKTMKGSVKDSYAELIASGVVKALNRMTPAQMAKLAARAHRTEEQRRAVAWLSGSTVTTFSVSEDGGLFAEAEHAFTPVPVDFTDLSKLPEIVAQTFDADTRTGKIAADITGCDENLAIDYLLGRLVPEICRTKSVVFDPVKNPPSGARYRVVSYERKHLHEKDIVQITFIALQ